MFGVKSHVTFLDVENLRPNLVARGVLSLPIRELIFSDKQSDLGTSLGYWFLKFDLSVIYPWV